MLYTVNRFTLNLADIVAIKDSSGDFIEFYIKTKPYYVYNPAQEKWEYHDEPTIVEQQFLNWKYREKGFEEWKQAWEENCGKNLAYEQK